MRVNRRKIRIEWGDCDPIGIVWYPNYFGMFDAGTHYLFESVGLTRQELLRRFGIAGMPIVDTGAKFMLPSAADDDIELESEVVEWGRSSFRVAHRAYKGGALALEGYELRVTVRQDNGTGGIKSVPIPTEVVAAHKTA
jgi:4-hydroxybenzoyl-CoA thioesterase